MTGSQRHGPTVIFDIGHGRHLHRLRPELAQVTQTRPSDPAHRAHALDALWGETQKLGWLSPGSDQTQGQ